MSRSRFLHRLPPLARSLSCLSLAGRGLAFLSLALLGLACLGLAGCRPATPAATDTLVYGRGEDANTLDPINTDIGESVKVIVNVCDTLVSYGDDSLDLAPALATSWSHSEDGRTWTFELRPNVTFHDGTPFNADAVVFSLERLIQENHPAVFDPARPYRPSYQMIERVQAEGPLRVTFQLHFASPLFLRNLAMFPASIVSPTAVQRLRDGFAAQPVGTGPFRLVRWQRQQQIVLEAFAEHWRGKPQVERAIFVPIAESATRIQQLLRGGVHIADDLPPAELDRLANTPGIELQETVGLNVAYLALQTEKPPLDQRKVRQAIALALDKEELVRVAYAGRARPAVTMVPPTMWAHHDGLADRPFDRQAARGLLQEAARELGLTLPLRLPLAVMAQPRPYLQQPLRVASFIKDALAPIGIEVQVESRPVNQHFETLMAGRFTMGLAGWSSDNSDPDNFLYSLLDPDNISEHGNNLSRYRSEPVHDLLLRAQRELNETAREKLYREAQEQIFVDVPVVPLAHANINVAQTARLKGYQLHPSALVYLRRAHFEGSP